MAEKQYNEFPAGVYDTSKIFLQADPITGALSKVNLPSSGARKIKFVAEQPPVYFNSGNWESITLTIPEPAFLSIGASFVFTAAFIYADYTGVNEFNLQWFGNDTYYIAALPAEGIFYLNARVTRKANGSGFNSYSVYNEQTGITSQYARQDDYSFDVNLYFKSSTGLEVALLYWDVTHIPNAT
jgi:hypothetical protein